MHCLQDENPFKIAALSLQSDQSMISVVMPLHSDHQVSRMVLRLYLCCVSRGLVSAELSLSDGGDTLDDTERRFDSAVEDDAVS